MNKKDIWLRCLKAACIYMSHCQSDKATLIDYANAFYEEAIKK